MKVILVCLAGILMTSVLNGMEAVSIADFGTEDNVTSEPLVCPDNFINLDDRCYFFATNGQRWFNAFKSCVTMGANLASLETLQEIEIVKEHLREIDPLRNFDWWLSASDDSQEGVFVWVNTMQLVEVTDWCPNDPNNYYDESCVYMVASCDYRWEERSCDYSARFICEV